MANISAGVIAAIVAGGILALTMVFFLYFVYRVKKDGEIEARKTTLQSSVPTVVSTTTRRPTISSESGVVNVDIPDVGGGMSSMSIISTPPPPARPESTDSSLRL